MLRRRLLSLSASVLALSGASVFAHPAAAASNAQAAAEPDTIGEVVVTARRRGEALQAVPIAITAITGEELTRRGVVSVDDLRNVTPGLNVGGLRKDDASFFLRGQGPGPAGTARSFPGVATYFAEVPTQMAGAGTLYDLGSVQVLKGPQGTLFGRNTTGGAVLFEPAKPTDQFEGYGKLSYGNFNYYEFEGMANIPIKSDKIDLRIAGQFSRRDGYTQSILTGQHLDDRNYNAARISLLLRPLDSVENLTIVDYRSQRGSGSSQVLIAVDPEAVLSAPIQIPGVLVGASGTVSIPVRAGGTVNVGCLSAALPGCPAGGAIGALRAAYANGAAGNPALGGLYVTAPTSVFEQYLATQQAIGPRYNQAPDLGYRKRLNIGVTNKTTIEVGENLTLKNIFGFRLGRLNESLDFDGTPITGLSQLYTTSQDWQTGFNQITEEFQVQGAIPSAKMKYILGYYYENSKPGFSEISPGLSLGSLQISYPDFLDRSNAVFGHVEWTPNTFFSLSGGLRKTWDNRMQALSLTNGSGGCIQIDPQTGAPACPLSYQADFSALTYDVTASVTPMHGVMVYLSYRKGYRSGGFNLPAPIAPPPNPNAYQTFGPMSVYSWELGLKGDWNVGVPLRTNISLFNDENQDIQTGVGVVTQTGLPAQIIVNAGKARNRGVEFETTVLPIRSLQVSGFVSYLEAFAKNDILGPNGQLAAIGGAQVPLSPRWKYGFSAAYTLPVPEPYGDVMLSADWSWQSSMRSPNLVSNYPIFPAYGVLNARLDWKNVFRSRVDVGVFGTNLTDSTYILGGYPLGNLGTEAAVYGEPRMFGVSATVHF